MSDSSNSNSNSESESESTDQSERFAGKRDDLVTYDIEARGIADDRVLDAMRAVHRERFVTPELADFAYEDIPLPIGSGQTISQPFIVALMAEAAEIAPSDRVLEVGTGSGYGAAVLSELAAEVWTIERHRSLAESAKRRLAAGGYGSVHVLVGDGTLGWPEQAPYDAIVVTAGGPVIPEALQEQLVDGGRLVIPAGSDGSGQSLLRVRRHGETFETEDLGDVRFVPLIGAQGWRSARPGKP